MSKKLASKSATVKSAKLTIEEKKAHKAELARKRRTAKKRAAIEAAYLVANAVEIPKPSAEITAEDVALVIEADRNGSIKLEERDYSELPSIKGTPEWSALEAKQILGETAIVWVVTEDAKGKAFTAPRYRVGLPAAKDTGYLIEAGRKIIGAGSSYAEAVKDARKRTAVKAAA